MSNEDQAPSEHPSHGINQNLVIALIGAAATILAALIPVFINMNQAQQPTLTAPPPTAAPATAQVTATDTAPPAFTSTPEPTETVAFTSTPVPPTGTPTTPVGIYDVYLAQDRAGQARTNVFSPLQTVYIFFNVNDLSGSNQVKVIWYAVDVQGFPTNTELSRDEGKVVRFPFSYEMLYSPQWKIGKYRVELYLNGSLAATEEFEIK